MNELIDDLLHLSRVSGADLRRTDIDLSRLATDVLAEMAIREPARVVRTVVQQGLTARADPQMVRVSFENLLGNAWKFTGKTEDAWVAVGAERRGGVRTLFVRDNGAGFDMAYRERLFFPFRRLHRHSDFPGTGIGLATVRRIVERHAGLVEAEGAVGEGACVYFTLEPAEQQNSTAEAPPAEGSPGMPPPAGSH